jgi:hypothetical protein
LPQAHHRHAAGAPISATSLRELGHMQGGADRREPMRVSITFEFRRCSDPRESTGLHGPPTRSDAPRSDRFSQVRCGDSGRWATVRRTVLGIITYPLIRIHSPPMRGISGMSQVPLDTFCSPRGVNSHVSTFRSGPPPAGRGRGIRPRLLPVDPYGAASD